MYITMEYINNVEYPRHQAVGVAHGSYNHVIVYSSLMVTSCMSKHLEDAGEGSWLLAVITADRNDVHPWTCSLQGSIFSSAIMAFNRTWPIV